MGTTYHIKVCGNDVASHATEWQQEIDSQLVRLNRLVSTYDPESELSRFNSSKSVEWFDVSTETARIVHRAIEISALSNGAFDPTVGPLVRAWGFGSGPRSGTAPSNETIELLRGSVGYQFVETRLEPPALRKQHADTELDLSAIAKGYGVDMISEWLASQSQVTGYMVEIGGEVRVFGRKNDDSLWTLAIEKPDEFRRELAYKISLRDESLATSGDYRNYFEQAGQRYSHTIDPQTGRPITHKLASVSVIAPDCMTADALATTLNVLGPEKGMNFAKEHQLVAMFLVRTETGFEERHSPLAADRFVSLQEPESQQASPGLIFLLTLGVFGLALVGLALGVIISNRRLKGTCGGLRGLVDPEGKSACELCSTPKDQCEEFRRKVAQSTQGSSEV